MVTIKGCFDLFITTNFISFVSLIATITTALFLENFVLIRYFIANTVDY